MVLSLPLTGHFEDSVWNHRRQNTPSISVRFSTLLRTKFYELTDVHVSFRFVRSWSIVRSLLRPSVRPFESLFFLFHSVVLILCRSALVRPVCMYAGHADIMRYALSRPFVSTRKVGPLAEGTVI